MNVSSCVAEYEVREYLAFREVIAFCCRHNCYYFGDASFLCIVSKSRGFLWAKVPTQLVADSRVDTPHVALLRALVAKIDSLGEHDTIVYDAMVRELLCPSAA